MPPLAKVMGFGLVVFFGTVFLLSFLLNNPMVTIPLGASALVAAGILKLREKG
jgi:hypothetical protein